MCESQTPPLVYIGGAAALAALLLLPGFWKLLALPIAGFTVLSNLVSYRATVVDPTTGQLTCVTRVSGL